MHKALLIVTILWIAMPVAQPSDQQAGTSGDRHSSAPTRKDKPVKSASPLSPDEIAIYRIVLQQYVSDSPGSLNVSATTEALDPTSPMNHFSDRECLHGIQLENIDAVSHSYHDLTADVLPTRDMKIVDPKKQSEIVRSNDPSKTIRSGKSVDNAVNAAFATGLFSMSEIAFDKEHRHAVVSYGFWCGSLCGNGSTLVFEKVADRWKIDHHCGGWVS